MYRIEYKVYIGGAACYYRFPPISPYGALWGKCNMGVKSNRRNPMLRSIDSKEL